MDWSHSDLIAFGGTVVVSFSALVAVFSYLSDVTHKKTELLYRVFERFYESSNYKNTRRILDNPSSPEFARLRSDVEQDANSAEYEAYIDYMNFFEFLCVLVERRRLSRKDLDSLFDYYLSNLSRHEFVRVICDRDGFESLARELRRRKPNNA